VANYEILEHKADLKIRVFGQTKEELFFNAMLGMEENMRPELKNKETAKRKIKIKSLDLPSLMIDFLSEVLYLIQINKEIYKNIKFKKLTDTETEAELTGLKTEGFGGEIKAVTHSGVDIRQNSDKNWQAIILFDV